MSVAAVFFCLIARLWVAWPRNSGRSIAVYRASDLITARRWLRVAAELPRSVSSQLLSDGVGGDGEGVERPRAW